MLIGLDAAATRSAELVIAREAIIEYARSDHHEQLEPAVIKG